MSFVDEKEAKRLFKELQFYNASIEKLYFECLKNRLATWKNIKSIVKTSKALKGYARSYRIEIIDSKDSSVQLSISKPSIEDLFKDLLKNLPVYFNSTAKTVIGPKSSLDKSFQEVFNGIDNWISEGYGWIIESIDAEYLQSIIGKFIHGITS